GDWIHAFGPDRRPPFVAGAAGDLDVAQVSRVQPGDRVAQPLRRTALRAGLADAVVLAGGLDDAASFAHVVAHRLFNVHVLAGLHGPNRHQRMPVVGRGGGDDVDRLVVEHLAQVFDVLGGLALLLLDFGDAVAADLLVDVA